MKLRFAFKLSFLTLLLAVVGLANSSSYASKDCIKQIQNVSNISSYNNDLDYFSADFGHLFFSENCFWIETEVQEENNEHLDGESKNIVNFKNLAFVNLVNHFGESGLFSQSLKRPLFILFHSWKSFLTN